MSQSRLIPPELMGKVFIKDMRPTIRIIARKLTNEGVLKLFRNKKGEFYCVPVALLREGFGC